MPGFLLRCEESIDIVLRIFCSVIQSWKYDDEEENCHGNEEGTDQ